MIKHITYIIFFSLLSLGVFSQEQVRIMGYNLLYYGSYTSFCTPENNSHEVKADYLITILEHAQPDILVVTEISPNMYIHNYLLGNVLNIDGVTSFRAAPVSNESGGNLANGLFYDNTKFDLFSHSVIQTDIRDLNLYRLRYLNTSETVFINIIVGHLKAGNNAADRAIRTEMIEAAMNHIESLGSNDNFLFMGDLNVYFSDEPAYQRLINPDNPAFAFFDPIDRPGHWHLNASFADIHSQSTRTDDSNSCFVVGGMDDRFDFILVDEAILEGSRNVLYKEDSYVTFGQDGFRFNSSLIEPENTSLPSEVISALYNMSDHLPVYADFYFGDVSNIASHTADQNFSARIANPIDNEFTYELKTTHNQNVDIHIYSIIGQQLYSGSVKVNKHKKGTIQANSMANGIYIITFTGDNFMKSYRIIKK